MWSSTERSRRADPRWVGVSIVVVLCSQFAPCSCLGQAPCGWSPLGPGLRWGVTSLSTFDEGAGERLFAGGPFQVSGNLNLNVMEGVGRWVGGAWSSLGGVILNSGICGSFSNCSSGVLATAVSKVGSGPALFVGGNFIVLSAGIPSASVARWDGSSWSPLGIGIPGGWPPTFVQCLQAFDDGSGEALYAGGVFTSAGGVTVQNIARWDGTLWSPLGSGVTTRFAPQPWWPIATVLAMAVFDDGTGPALYVGGLFDVAGDVNANNLARWDGVSWSGVGGGLNGRVHSLQVFDDGGGPALYVGGAFSRAGSTPAANIARWDGVSWRNLGEGIHTGFTPNLPPIVVSLAGFDDGRGPALYAGGRWRVAGSAPSTNIARWDGARWSSLGPGLSLPGQEWGESVEALAVHDDGTGRALYAGGWFSDSGPQTVRSIARWSCPTVPYVTLEQPGGPGTGLLIQNGHLRSGREYVNLFSIDPCPGPPGSGPILGLCASTAAGIQFMQQQVVLPVGTFPFHFQSSSTHLHCGPYAVSLPLTLEATCVGLAGASISSVSPIS